MIPRNIKTSKDTSSFIKKFASFEIEVENVWSLFERHVRKVFSNDTFESWKIRNRAVERLHRVLKKGGAPSPRSHDGSSFSEKALLHQIWNSRIKRQAVKPLWSYKGHQIRQNFESFAKRYMPSTLQTYTFNPPQRRLQYKSKLKSRRHKFTDTFRWNFWSIFVYIASVLKKQDFFELSDTSHILCNEIRFCKLFAYFCVFGISSQRNTNLWTFRVFSVSEKYFFSDILESIYLRKSDYVFMTFSYIFIFAKNLNFRISRK